MLFEQKTPASGFEVGGNDLKVFSLVNTQHQCFSWIDESCSSIVTLDNNSSSINSGSNSTSSYLQQVFNNIPCFLFPESVPINEEEETFHFTTYQQQSTASSRTHRDVNSNSAISPRTPITPLPSPTPSSPAFSSSSSSPSSSLSSSSFLSSPSLTTSPSLSPSSNHFSDSKLTVLTPSSTELTTLVNSLHFTQNTQTGFEEDSSQSLTELKPRDKVILYDIDNNYFTSQDNSPVNNAKVSAPSMINSSNNTVENVRNIGSTTNNNNSYSFNDSYEAGVHTTKLPDIWSSFGASATKTMAYSEVTRPQLVDIMDDDSCGVMGMEPYFQFQDVHFSPFAEGGEFFQMDDWGTLMDSSTSEEEGDTSPFNESSGEDSIHTLHPNFRTTNGFPYSYHDPFNINGQSSHDVEVTDDQISSDIVSNQTQSSPISNDSSSDWPEVFENKLPVFKEIEDPTTESEKRTARNKRSTPSPRQKRKSSDSPTCNEKERKKPGRKPGQVSNVLHLWEFMRDLLNDPTISDGVIQWVSKADGVFRVVDSAEVARLWGQKKNNKKEMTYEKLSRSLRYSRLEGYFDSLPKDKNYPKKLCFKFGPKSRHFR